MFPEPNCSAVLLEVNVSGEPTKSGFDRAELQRSAERLCEFSNVAVSGLMTMAPATRDLDTARKVFSQLRELRNGLATATGLPLQELSMGMSGDFETAIEEGATIVRVGSRLFAGLPYRA